DPPHAVRRAQAVRGIPRGARVRSAAARHSVPRGEPPRRRRGREGSAHPLRDRRGGRLPRRRGSEEAGRGGDGRGRSRDTDRAGGRGAAPPRGRAASGGGASRCSAARRGSAASTGRRPLMGRWTIVNAVLALMVALLGFEIARTWAHRLPAIEVPPSPMPPPDAPGPEGHEKGKHGAGGKDAARTQQTPAIMVAAISEKDLFDPSRRPPTPDEVKVDVAPPVTKPPDGVTIVGVRIFGKDREVFMNDATQAPATGRRL